MDARTTLAILTFALAASGCLVTRSPAWTTRTSAAIAVMPAADAAWGSADAPHESTSAATELVARGEVEWAQRGSAAHARAAVDAWARALEAAPTDAVLWARLSRAEYFLADVHLAADPAEATEVFASAIFSGERSLLARAPSIGPLMRSGVPFTAALGAMQAADVPGLYWRTLALWRWARANGAFVQQSVREEVRASMARVAELDRAYDGAGADRFLGDVWATTSTVWGGDLERAHAHFEYAIDAAPSHFATRVLYALDYATKLEDRALFEHELSYVIASDPGDADVAPENVAEQARARAALERVARLFP